MKNHAPRVALLLAAALLLSPGAQAQNTGLQLSIGPQLTTLGIGLGADLRLIPQLSLSAEYNIFPIREIDLEDELLELYDLEDADNLDSSTELDIQGGLLAVNLHPFGGKFALGFGIFLGSYEGDLTVSPAEAVEVGDETYTPEEIGTLFGRFTIGDTAPAVYLGWRGRGFHFGAGIATRAPSDVELSANGPISTLPEFQRELEAERAEIQDELDRVTVLPFIRLGWQFGL